MRLTADLSTSHRKHIINTRPVHCIGDCCATPQSGISAEVTGAGLTIRGPRTNVRRGPFFIRVAVIFSGDSYLGALFLPKKLTTFFSRRYV